MQDAPMKGSKTARLACHKSPGIQLEHLTSVWKIMVPIENHDSQWRLHTCSVIKTTHLSQC